MLLARSMDIQTISVHLLEAGHSIYLVIMYSMYFIGMRTLFCVFKNNSSLQFKFGLYLSFEKERKCQQILLIWNFI